LRRSIAERTKLTPASVAILTTIAKAFSAERTILPGATVAKAVLLPVLAILPVRLSRTVAAPLPLALKGLPFYEGLGAAIRRWSGLRLKSGLLIGTDALGGRREPVGQAAELFLLLKLLFTLAWRARLAALSQRLRRLRCCNEPKIVLRVLKVVFGRHRIAARVSVAR